MVAILPPTLVSGIIEPLHPLIYVEFVSSSSFVYGEIAGFLCSTFPASDAKRDALEANTATGEG